MVPSGAGAACLATAASSKVVLPDLPYDFGALEPFISADIMKLHHGKHHAAYVNNLNAAMEQYAEAEHKKDVSKMISLQGAIRFNGGGHINHDIFWTNLAPSGGGGGGEPEGELKKYIEKSYGSFEKFKTTFNAQTVAVQGSGWGWLGYDKATDTVRIQTMPNQDPLSMTGLVPLLGIDVWEHAYYLQYRNVRPDYLNQIWNVVNFSNVASRLAAAKRA